MRLTVKLMDDSVISKMQAARDRGFTSCLFEALDAGAARVLSAYGFNVVAGRKGTFVNWDRVRPTTSEGVPANLAAHYKASGELDIADWRQKAYDARQEYKKSLAA